MHNNTPPGDQQGRTLDYKEISNSQAWFVYQRFDSGRQEMVVPITVLSRPEQQTAMVDRMLTESEADVAMLAPAIGHWQSFARTTTKAPGQTERNPVRFDRCARS